MSNGSFKQGGFIRYTHIIYTRKQENKKTENTKDTV